MRAGTPRTALLLLAVAGCTGEPAPPAAEVPDPDLAGGDATVVEVIGMARAALLRDRRSPEAWGRFGIVLDAHKLHEDALACYEQAMRLDPSDERWPYLAGVIAQLDDPEEGVVLLGRAAALEPGSAPIRGMLASALVRAGRNDEARSQFEAALAIDPGTRQALVGLGGLALQEGSLDEALDLLTRAARIEFCEHEVHAKLARLHRRRGDAAGAERESLLARAYPEPGTVEDPIRAVVDQVAVSSTAWSKRGLRLMARRQAAEAEDAFRRALDLRPDSVSNNLNLGGALVEQDRVTEGIEHFRGALAIAPQDAEVHNNLAVAYERLGDLDSALDHLAKALAYDPANDRALFNRGRVRERQGRLADADADYRRALEINPVNARAHNNLAVLSAKAGRRPEAVEHWRDAVEMGCFPADAVFNLAVEIAQAGRFGEAVALLDRGLARAPRDEPMLAALATILATCPDARHRDGTRAVLLARRLIEINGPRHVPSLNLLAAGLAEAGDFGAAVATSYEALGIAERSGDRGAMEMIGRRLALYTARKPYHQ